MQTKMKRWLVIALVGMIASASETSFAGTSQRLNLENLISDRAMRIIGKVDPDAVIQSKVILKNVTSSLPGVWMNAKVVPLTQEGELGTESIEKIQVRVITQVNEVPEWVKKEVSEALDLAGLKANIVYEKAKGTIQVSPNDPAKWVPNAMKDASKDFSSAMADTLKPLISGGWTQSLNLGMWIIAGAVAVALGFVAFSVVVLGRKLEAMLNKALDEKLVPAIAAGGKGGGGGGGRIERDASARDAKPQQIQLAPGAGGGGSGSGLNELSVDVLLVLFADCYWTQSDGYANYLWQQMSQKQREGLLAVKDVQEFLGPYFAFIRRFEPNNLNYHFDARYMMSTPDFNRVSQDDLAGWLLKNPNKLPKVTPLRWDFLPIPLSDRVRLSAMPAPKAGADDGKIEIKAKSAPRTLPIKLEVKQLTPADEEFVWGNPTMVPPELRSSLKTLAWLALSTVEYRKKILSEIDARQLAEAWTGPEEVLAKLKEAIPEKKFDMLQSMLKENQPDRDGEVFAFLADAGVKGLAEAEAAGSAEAPSREKGAA